MTVNYRNVGLPCYPLAFRLRPARGTKIFKQPD